MGARNLHVSSYQLLDHPAAEPTTIVGNGLSLSNRETCQLPSKANELKYRCSSRSTIDNIPALVVLTTRSARLESCDGVGHVHAPYRRPVLEVDHAVLV